MTANKTTESKEMPELKPGMTVRVHEKIREKNAKGEEKERTQIFEGIIIAKKHGNQPGATITVRKVTEGIGVEKIYPIHSPIIAKIQPIRAAKVSRAKIGFVRNYKKRLKEAKI